MIRREKDATVTRPATWPDRAGADTLAVEEPLELRVHGERLVTTMRTPGSDAELALGFLFSEGLIRSAQDISSLSHCGRADDRSSENVLDIVPAPGVVIELEASARRGAAVTSSCGVCGRQQIDDLLAGLRPLAPGAPLPMGLLERAPAALGAAQPLFTATGGVHAAALFDASGELLVAKEDVGRHNAVDKAIGALLRSGRLPSTPPALLFVSSRASFDIVQKAARAQIPFVACMGAASSLAVELAERCGICLTAFARADRSTVYTFPERLSHRAKC